MEWESMYRLRTCRRMGCRDSDGRSSRGNDWGAVGIAMMLLVVKAREREAIEVVTI